MLTVYLTDPHHASREYLGRVATYIHSHSTLTDWTLALLNECWLLEIADGAYWAAIMWANRTAVEGELELHAVAAPEYRGRWITRGVAKQVDQVIDHTGATRLIAQVPTPLIARYWKRFGFTIVDQLAYKDIDRGRCE